MGRGRTAATQRLDVELGQVAAQHPGQGAHERHADLDGGQERVRVVLQVLDPRGRAGCPRRSAPRSAPRLAEMSAISLPEKNPFPSRQKKIAAIRKPHSFIGAAILAFRSRAAALSALRVFDSVKGPQATRGGGLANGETFDLVVIGSGPGGLRGRHPGRPDGPQDRGRGARSRRLRRHLPPARLHPHQGPAAHRRPLRGPEERQGVRDRGRQDRRSTSRPSWPARTAS